MNCIAISTFMKPDALAVLCRSLLANNYLKDNYLFIADDYNGQAIEGIGSSVDVFNEMKEAGVNVTLMHGPRGGIKINKNRLLYLVVQKKDIDWALILDDDIEFHQPGLLEAMVESAKACNLSHLNAFWPEDPENVSRVGVSGKSWWVDFPIEALTDHDVHFRRGSHGSTMLFSREAIEKTGYMVPWNSNYGYEHTLYSKRVLLAVDHRSPDFLPCYSRGHKYYKAQAVPNRYHDHAEGISLAGPLYEKYVNDIHAGKNLYNKDHGLNLKKETILRSHG